MCLHHCSERCDIVPRSAQTCGSPDRGHRPALSFRGPSQSEHRSRASLLALGVADASFSVAAESPKTGEGTVPAPGVTTMRDPPVELHAGFTRARGVFHPSESTSVPSVSMRPHSWDRGVRPWPRTRLPWAGVGQARPGRQGHGKPDRCPAPQEGSPVPGSVFIMYVQCSACFWALITEQNRRQVNKNTRLGQGPPRHDRSLGQETEELVL